MQCEYSFISTRRPRKDSSRRQGLSKERHIDVNVLWHCHLCGAWVWATRPLARGFGPYEACGVQCLGDRGCADGFANLSAGLRCVFCSVRALVIVLADVGRLYVGLLS